MVRRRPEQNEKVESESESCSVVSDSATPWTAATPWIAAYQAPLSMGFSRQEYWSGVPLPSLISLIHSHFKYFLPFNFFGLQLVFFF